MKNWKWWAFLLVGTSLCLCARQLLRQRVPVCTHSCREQSSGSLISTKVLWMLCR